MSLKQVEAFYQKLSEDKNLKDQIMEIKDTVEVMYEKLTKIAQDAGFDVAVDDVREYWASQQLSDEALDQVAGGGGCTSVCDSICGLFLGHWMGRQ